MIILTDVPFMLSKLKVYDLRLISLYSFALVYPVLKSNSNLVMNVNAEKIT